MEDQQKVWGFFFGALIGLPLAVAALALIQFVISSAPKTTSIIAVSAAGIFVGLIVGYFLRGVKEKRRKQ